MNDNPFFSPAADGIRNAERDRIVAIIERTRKWHEASKFNDVESAGRVHVAITYAIEVLDSILAEIYNAK